MNKCKKIKLPDFGRAKVCPIISIETYLCRIEKTIEKMHAIGLDFLVIYADREHCANLSYLTGFDPRFEESLLLLDKDGRRKLLVGNECIGYLPSERLKIEIELFQELSLMGQQRDSSRTLRDILIEFKIGGSVRIGCAGWKTQSSELIGLETESIEIPSYIVDLLRELIGNNKNVINANDIFMGLENGLRIINEPEQIAYFEYASTIASDAMHNFIKNLKPGIKENEIASAFNPCGLTLSCHTMTSFGEKVKRGLSSPSDNRAELGDPFTSAFGVAGALTSRAGFVVDSLEDIPANIRDFYTKYINNYFAVVTKWYESIKVGISGGEVYAVVEQARNPELFNFCVNPGHYLHLDEWVNSPFSHDNKTYLKSGMAIQMDIIPVSNGPFCYNNMEDGVVLADEKLCAEFTSNYPKMWQRIQMRRDFMINELGIKLDKSVLPLSNIPAWLPPFALNSDLVMSNK